MKIVIFILFIQFFSFGAKKTKAFMPYMLSHMYKGCPQNSSCIKELGKLKLKWDAILAQQNFKRINHFINTYGFPLTIWSLSINKKIAFDSRCQNHRLKKPTIYEGIIFSSSPKNIYQKKDFLPNFILHKEEMYIIPRKSIPYQVKNNIFYFHKENNGIHYNLLVGKNNFLSKKVSPIRKEILDATCTKKTKEKYSSLIKHKNLFTEIYCKKIWDEKEKKYTSITLGWSCL